MDSQLTKKKKKKKLMQLDLMFVKLVVLKLQLCIYIKNLKMIALIYFIVSEINILIKFR